MANSYDITVMRKLEKQIEELLAESQRYRTALEKISECEETCIGFIGKDPNHYKVPVALVKTALLPREGK